MSFGENIERREEAKKAESKFKKVEFIHLEEGENLVRLLEPMETRAYGHFMGRTWVKCLADECPVCASNKKILYEHPEDFREVKGWNPRRARYSINVLDKTKAKVCSKCGAEVKKNVPSCPACATILGEAQPLNKVKLLSRGSTLFEDLAVLANTTRTENDEVVDVRTYDFLLIVRGEGRETVITVSPRYNPATASLPQGLESLELFDHDKAMVSLTASEMVDVMNGATLKDIFTIRRATSEAMKQTKKVNTDLVSEEIQASIDNIFKG